MCYHRLRCRVLARAACDVRGESQPFTVRLFVESRGTDKQKTAPLSRTTVRLFNLILAGVSGVAVTRPGDAAPDGTDGRPRRSTAFRILCSRNVLDFDLFLGFLFLVLHVVTCPLLGCSLFLLYQSHKSGTRDRTTVRLLYL